MKLMTVMDVVMVEEEMAVMVDFTQGWCLVIVSMSEVWLWTDLSGVEHEEDPLKDLSTELKRQESKRPGA